MNFQDFFKQTVNWLKIRVLLTDLVNTFYRQMGSGTFGYGVPLFQLIEIQKNERIPEVNAPVQSPINVHCAPKGQLISEQIYAVLKFPKMQRNIARISALAS